MDKSMDATTAAIKVSSLKTDHDSHVYDDVALVILSKLPLKSLFRFCCVRKSWSVLFQNSYFMDMFRRNFLSKDHSYYNDTSLILYHRIQHLAPSELYSLFGERFENTVKLDWPNPLVYFNFHPLASVNGILCMEGITRDGTARDDNRRVVLWNPATHEYKVSPPSPFAIENPCRLPSIQCHGFGYDQVSHDYKVIRHINFLKGDWKTPLNLLWDTSDNLWEIYCLKSNKWRKLDLDMPTQSYSDVGAQVYTEDGVCHWWGYYHHQSESDDNVYLVSFDLNNETFVKTSIPSYTNYIHSPSEYVNRRHLNLLNGSIGLISYDAEGSNFHISILGQVGIKESWIKLFIVGPLPCVEHPIGIGKKGDIFFKKKDDELVWFNLNTQKIEEVVGKGDDYSSRILIYKESFLPLFERIND